MSSPEPGNQTRASAYPPTGSAYPSGVDPPHGVPVPPLQPTAPVEESDSCRSREPSLSQALDGTSVTLLTWASLPTAHLLVSTVVALNSSSKGRVQLPGPPTGVGLPRAPGTGPPPTAGPPRRYRPRYRAAFPAWRSRPDRPGICWTAR